jgi:hypothetical protein
MARLTWRNVAPVRNELNNGRNKTEREPTRGRSKNTVTQFQLSAALRALSILDAPCVQMGDRSAALAIGRLLVR